MADFNLEAMCARCRGEGCDSCGRSGKIKVSLADGQIYSLECKICDAHIGGCVVGGTSPLKEVPPAKDCVFCGGEKTAVYKLEEIDGRFDNCKIEGEFDAPFCKTHGCGIDKMCEKPDCPHCQD